MTATTPSLFPAAVGRHAEPVPEAQRQDITIRLAEVGLPGGRTVRVALHDGFVIIGNGFRSESALTSVAHGVRIEAEAWPAIVAAVEELRGEG
jgi:hypothetical protein